MALTTEVKQALANSARIQMLEAKIARLNGQAETNGSLSRLLSSQGSDIQQRLVSAQTELDALKLAAGPGITDEFGERTTVDNSASAERGAGMQAAVLAIKTDPALTQDQVREIWTAAALATRPADRQWLLSNPDALLKEYTANLMQMNAITEPTWEELVAWVVRTPVEDMP